MGPEYIEISTKVGKIKGLVKTSVGRSNTTYYSFQGVPYAKPPIGKLRFKAPEPCDPWEGVRDATKEGNDSLQYHLLFKHLSGDEDCLYLNVYTPQKPAENVDKKAVMVFIHSGGFARGSGSTEIYGPDYLIEENIVLVTINYRCGVLGFLSLESEILPGNAGLRDQLMALYWVRNNISAFGGDPNNVTLFGESAGGSSVNYHLISPLSKGLFHKAILQSGSALCQWAFQHKPREKALLLASKLGCTSQDDETVLQFLMTVSAAEIVDIQENESITSDKEKIQSLGLTFVPCVELVGGAPFLPDYPRRLMERGEFFDIPVIMGVTDKEGLVCVALKEFICDRVNKDPSVMVPINLNIPAGSAEEKALGKEILQFYTNTDTLNWDIDVIEGYVDFMTDTAFASATGDSRLCFLQHLKSPVYSYMFSFKCSSTLTAFLIKLAYPDMADQLVSLGASHSDDLISLFKTHILKTLPSADDLIFMNKILKAWTTFAKTGNPNCPELGVTWQPDTIGNPNYMDLGEIPKSTHGTIFPKRLQFWKNIYDKYSYLY